MAQQTAVEWLEDSLIGNPHTENDFMHNRNVFQQAKQMEKEQIEDAHIEGQRVFDKHPHTQWTNDQAEQYYNETYGTEGR
jgi:hypothetical protein